MRAEGDAAVLDYTRRFDTAGSEPRPLLVSAQELDEAIKRMSRELVAGLQVAIANVARVAEAGIGADASVELAQGQRVTLREVPVGSAAVYVPGGRAPYPEHGRDGRRHRPLRRRARRGGVRAARAPTARSTR